MSKKLVLVADRTDSSELVSILNADGRLSERTSERVKTREDGGQVLFSNDMCGV